jgi:hypothetical protein
VLTPYLNPSNMPSKVSERAVTEFLRDALALDGLGVSKLNAMARAAGLLGERQRITDAKAFRRAKVLLGIRSVRDGFGPRGGWLWELPPRSDVPPPISTRQERSAPTSRSFREWVEGVARHTKQPAELNFRHQTIAPRKALSILQVPGAAQEIRDQTHIRHSVEHARVVAA